MIEVLPNEFSEARCWYCVNWRQGEPSIKQEGMSLIGQLSSAPEGTCLDEIQEVNIISTSCFVTQPGCLAAHRHHFHWCLSLYGNGPTNTAYLSFTFNKTAASNDHSQMTLSGANWIDVCIMRLDTKGPVLHKAAMMDTMSPSLFRINGKMKWVVCLGTCHAGDGCH